MSVTSNGSKGEPQFASTGNSPTFSDDLSVVSDYAGAVGNRIAGTHAQRVAFDPPGVDSSYFSDGPWAGLQWYETDTNCLYSYTGTAWTIEDVVGVIRRRVGRMNMSGSSGISLGTLSLPAQPVATRVIVDIAGQVGFAAGGGDFSVTMSYSAGVATEPGGVAVPTTAAKWTQYPRKVWVDLPANTALTVTFTGYSSSGNGWWDVGAELNALLPGQY